MKHDAPLVSVVTASFNALDGLKATVESVRAQGFRSVEHVIVDGGSADGTPEWLAQNDDLVWVSEPDGGIADAMNKGVAMARGDWILVLQAGDRFVDETTLGQAAEHLDGALEAVCFDVLFETAAGVRRLTARPTSPKLVFKTTIPHQGAFCARSLFGRIGGFDETLRIAMDYDFFLRASRGAARMRRVPLAVARMPDDGVSSRTDWPSLARRFGEERRIHRAHCTDPAMRALHAVYWPLYLAYRRARFALRPGPAPGGRPG